MLISKLLVCTLSLLCSVFPVALADEDLYNLLGVSKDATTQQIKRAFRKQAYKYHPDKNKSKEAEEMYLKINRAHEILSDEDKRQRYDRYGMAAFKDDGDHPGDGSMFHSGGDGGFFNFDGIFESMFGSRGGGDQPFNFEGEGSQQHHGANQEEMFMHFGDSFFGGEMHQSSETCRTVTQQVGDQVITHTECF